MKTIGQPPYPAPTSYPTPSLTLKDVKDDKGALASNPLFYETMDDLSADTIQAVSNEIQAVSRRLEVVLGADVFSAATVKSVLDSLREHYVAPVEDDLKLFFQSAPGFKGIFTPMIKSGEKWMPDWKSRYFTEDIPALCIIEALAALLNAEPDCEHSEHLACGVVKTPTIKTLIQWGQEKLGKEFLVGTTLNGRDLKEFTCIPQNFGATSINSMKELHMLD